MSGGTRILKVGNAQAFWGDDPYAPSTLVSQQPDLDYLTLDYLAEVSLSIMASQREKNPSAGYAQDFIAVIQSLIPYWKKNYPFKVVTNAGGLNPRACAEACLAVIKSAGLTLKIGIVSGDDVIGILHEGVNLDSGEPLQNIQEKLVTANAYLGAAPIAKALRQGAHVVITGRVADPSLTVGPCLAHFNWKEQDYDKIAGATIAGHLIECGTQVTGGIYTHWLDIPEAVEIGFPVAEIAEDGSFVVTKPPKTGGQVNQRIVKEQLLYEIGDPDRYLSPDATVSLMNLQLEEDGRDRVRVNGAKGKEPPASYKVSATYRGGFKAEGMIGVFGPEAAKKARRCGEIVLERVKRAGYAIQKSSIECLGCGDMVPGVLGDRTQGHLECILRICVIDSRKEAVDCFVKEIAPLVTSGPQGICGYVSGRPKVRPVFNYWPCLIPMEKVFPQVQMIC